MRKYDESENRKLIEVYCNKCGKKMTVMNGIITEGAYTSLYNWGYFSEKDGEIHSFDLCEECYNSIISEFKIKVDINDNNELI